jgi:hypothetical protein
MIGHRQRWSKHADIRSPCRSRASSYANFRRALESGNLTRVRAAAAESPSVELEDPLAICRLMRDDEPVRCGDSLGCAASAT